MVATLERKPAVVGRFYPGDSDVLRPMITRFLDVSDVAAYPERVVGIVVPHAGYPFSAATAAHAYARVRGDYFRRVVLLGCSHHYRFEGASIVGGGRFETPLGDLPIADDLAAEIARAFGSQSLEPHLPEHSLEVQLPFVQVALGAPKIVPVLFGSACSAWHTEFGRTLAGMLAPTDLVVVSTDLSHYHSEADANARDRRSLDIVLSGDVDAIVDAAASRACDMCGVAAVAAGVACAKERGATVFELLDYRTSAAASGDTSRVVGYGAISMERDA